LWKREWRNFDTSLRSLKTLVNKQLTDTDILQAGGQINKLISFMEWNQARLNTWLSRLASQRKLVEADKHTIAVGVDSFLESTKELLMMPCSALLEGFPRLVREMSRDLGKELDLTMRGTQVELDRRILTRMRDPLIHLIRNSIDHGIEPPEVRVKAGKPKKGMLTVAVTQDETGKVEISINDDGAGVDTAKVAAAAIKAGIINESEAHGMSAEDQLDLIFQSAVTTSPIITEISGHGLGLAIVKENVDSLGGRIKLETTPGVGTSIKIFLPVAIATFQGILLSVAGETVTLPKTNLLRVLRLHESEIRTIEDKDAFAFQDTLRPLIKLADLLELRSGMDATGKEPEQLPFLLVAVVRAGEEVLGLIVDDVLEEQEVMVKKLGKPLSRVRNIAGVTILRTGKAVPVLNVMDLMKSARRLSGRESGPSVQLLAPRPKKRILVVEDTLTSRMLIKNIIEAAGYEVKTATDGVEAFAELTSEPFDLVLADVEMPRMNGLELTKRIRENAKIADLPVVLLTSLASREHREKGVQAGANAYFTKGSFDQTNLLDVIKRLI
jgi:two-component system chemotaxis sensor kinase CheA